MSLASIFFKRGDLDIDAFLFGQPADRPERAAPHLARANPFPSCNAAFSFRLPVKSFRLNRAFAGADFFRVPLRIIDAVQNADQIGLARPQDAFEAATVSFGRDFLRIARRNRVNMSL